MDSSSTSYILQLIAVIVVIALVVIWARSIRKHVREKQPFSGVGWGLVLGGLFGAGLLPVLIAQSNINSAIDKVKSKKYLAYAKKQMKDFTKIYSACFITWIVVAFVPLIGIIVGVVLIPLMLYLCSTVKIEYPTNLSHDSDLDEPDKANSGDYDEQD